MMNDIVSIFQDDKDLLELIPSSSFIIDYLHEIRDIFDLPEKQIVENDEFIGRRRNVGQSSGIILQLSLAEISDEKESSVNRIISNRLGSLPFVEGHDLYLGVSPTEYTHQYGIISINVYFEGYRQYYQNESRKNFKNTLPKRINQTTNNPTITSKTFALIKRISIKDAAMGVHYQYFFNSESISLEEVLNAISDYCDGNAKWMSFDIVCLVPIGE
jgi:hypothetical protein